MFHREIIALILLTAAVAAPHASATAQTERRTISGDRIAIYNLAGKVRVEPGRGPDVVVEITRGGRDAEQLRIEEGTIRNAETLRVLYPSDHIIYPAMERSSRTTLSVRDDGTWGGRQSDHADRERNRVEISSSGRGMEAYADLRILGPRGQ